MEGKEGLPGERRLVSTHLIWGEECVLAWEDRFVKGLGVSFFSSFSGTFAAVESF